MKSNCRSLVQSVSHVFCFSPLCNYGLKQFSEQHLAKGTPGSCLGIASCCVSDFGMAINEATNFLPIVLRMSPRYWKPRFSSFLCLRQFEHVFPNFKRGLRPQVYIAKISEFLGNTPLKAGCATRKLTVLLPRGAGKS